MLHVISQRISGFPRLLESPGFFSLKFHYLDSPGKISWKLRITEISCISSTKFGQLILSKIVKIVATRCHILRLKCTKFDFGWGSSQCSPRSFIWISRVLFQIEGERRGGRSCQEETEGFFFIFKHLWAPKRSCKISHEGPGKFGKSPGFFCH